MMRFRIPDSLLERLRARREEQRQARQAHAAAARPQRNFIDSIRHLFSGQVSAHDAALCYVAAMNTWQDEIEIGHDAFLLDPGMGPMVYLTSDGRILEDSRGWDGDSVVELAGDRANAALVVGALKTGIMELVDLIEPPPPGATVCEKCHGARIAEPVPGFGHELPCDACGCRG
jgi:hypothetical protein